MERSKHQQTGSNANESEGFKARRAGFTSKAFLSLFSCSASVAEHDEDPDTRRGLTTKRPIVSLIRPRKQKRRRSASKNTQVQHGSSIALSTALKRPEADDRHKEESCKTQPPAIDVLRKSDGVQLPNISDPSLVLSEISRGLLCTLLPTLARGCEWVLLYSTWKHGMSLRTLYRNSNHFSGPFLLAVQDSEGVAFGGLLTGLLDPSIPKFQGTQDSFLFTNVAGDMVIFRATGRNRYYYLCTSELLGLGAGPAFALQLDGDLTHGSSGLSETFGNSCLSHAEDFSIRHVEVWRFEYTSKYVP